ncbi:SCO family protein [Ampullimonas aquatilis]|uniref:SCO family protein n=1 Tax=Ampullimonas aquatilis TaxID=1341549 RepID=UPI003C75E362
MSKQVQGVDAQYITSKRNSGRRKLMIVLVICALPMIASYISYYFIKPTGRLNYGKLLEPQKTIPSLILTETNLVNFPIDSLKGKWLMITVGGAKCDQACEEQLFYLRQIRLAQGKDSDRITRLRLVTDNENVDSQLSEKYAGTLFLRADEKQIVAWLSEGEMESINELSTHIFLVDPLGNLMMRFPAQPDPSKVKKDIIRLLKASSIG